ncbi:hypothetical protein TWF696_002955 [Orbilia brochopaga]|uniref:DUF6697 domain-containing protein n=1 Tax=Orbilia brochopaga TaxID=3140254 RepID=A0AAV9U181_9PEZI
MYRKTQPTLTEPLMPQEWADFSISIGEESQPEHLRFSSPSWNLELMRTVATELWQKKGKEGVPGPPKPISTAMPTGNLGDWTDGIFISSFDQSELPSSPGAVWEGRERKRKAIDYSIFSAGLDHDYDSNDDLNSTRRGRRRYRSKTVASSDAMDEDGIPTSSIQQPNAPYSGKKRGRPKKIVLDAAVTASPSDDITMPDAPSQMLASSPCRQQERRHIFREAVKEVALLESPNLKQLAIRSTVQSAQQQQPDSITGMNGDFREATGQGTKSNDFENTECALQTAGTSPTSSVYEDTNSSPSSAAPLPAGTLRMTELPRHIAATIPTKSEFFSRRDHIGPLIGGNHRTLVTPIPNPKSEAPIITKGYLAIQTAWNPHAPRKAGQNGSIMQLSKTSLDPISKSQETFPVFVARGSHQWEYCGQYIVAEVAELSSFERWLHLIESQNLLKHWGKEIARKRYEWAKELFVRVGGWGEEQWNAATATTVADMIERGSVPMHWVHLQCVGFDWTFYDALLRAKTENRDRELSHTRIATDQAIV